MNETSMKTLRQLFMSKGPILRSKQLKLQGYDSRGIKSLLATNTLVRLKDGYYTMSDLLPQLSDTQIAVSTIPGAVLYYLSAAEFHQLTHVIPNEVYVAVPNKGVIPTRPEFPPVEITRFIPRIYGIGRIIVNTTTVPMACYNRERTICDLAKRWEEIGKDVLIEAIRNYLKGTRNLQLLYEYIDALNVRNVIHPYLEVMV
jgi:predicted transcriptional regulator of viral defense system